MIDKTIDYNLKLIKPELFILKPNKTTIGKLKEAYDIKAKTKLGNVNELEFKIPYFIEFNHKIIDNPNIAKLKDKYLIRFKLGKKQEIFQIDEYIDDMEQDTDSKLIKCFSLSMELSNFYIRDYDATGFTLDEIFNGKTHFPPEFYGDNYNPTPIQEYGILFKTDWKVTHIDTDYDNIKMSYVLKNSSTTILNAIFSILDLYKATAVFDTENRTIQIKTPQSQTSDKGLTFSYGHYLKTLKNEVKTEKMVTRLYVYGASDGNSQLDISSVSPAGSGYIESYAYFMYPFERDGDKNIIKHSDYMSDDLCHAILDYEQKIEENKDILKQKTDEIMGLYNELYSLQAIEQQLYQDVINAQYTHYVKWVDREDTDSQYRGEPYTEEEFQEFIDDTAEWQAVVAAREVYFTQVGLVNAKLSQIQAEELTRQQIVYNLSEEVNFTSEQLKEKKQFTIEREFADSNQVNPERLYERGLEEFRALQMPEKSIRIDIVNFLDCIEEQWNWDRLELGARVTIKNEMINVYMVAKIIEIEYDFNSGDINLTIANEDDLSDDGAKLAELMNRMINTSVQVERTRPLWEKLERRESEISRILDEFWDDIHKQVTFAANQSVVIDEMGITIYELDEDGNKLDRFLRATNGVLAITDDGGKSYKHAITADGIISERLMGRIIMGEQLTLGDPDGILEIHGNKGTIYDRWNREVMAFGLYNYDHKGIEDYRNPHVDYDLDRFGIRLYGKYPSYDPYEQPRTKVVIDSNDGLYIDKWENFDGKGYDWRRKFYVDSDGALFAENMTTYGLIIKQKEDGVILLDADKRFMNIGRMAELVTDNSLTPLEKLQVKAEWKRIEYEYLELKRAYEEHRYSYRDYNSPFGKQGNIDHLNTPSSPVWDEYPSEKKVEFWNVYINAYNELNRYLNDDIIIKPEDKQGALLSDIRSDLTERPDNIDGDEEDFGTGFNRDIFLEKFQGYYDTALNLVDAINTLIRWSAMELGRNYNNVVIDAMSGIVVTRNDNEVQTILNASEGISIARRSYSVPSLDRSLNYWHEGVGNGLLEWSKVFFANTDGSLKMLGSLEMTRANGFVRVMIDQNDNYNIFSIATDASVDPEPTFTDALYTDRSGKTWNRKLYMDIDGVLHATDLIANRLLIRDGAGHIIIDADSKFLNLNEFDKIDGNIQAENISAKIITADVGFINDLTVNHLKTLGIDAYGQTRNYIDIKDNSAKWITGDATGGSIQATNRNGDKLYWMDSEHTSTTIQNTGIPVMVENYNEVVKMEIYFEGQDPTHYPIIKMGAGVGTGDNGIAFIYKSDGFYIDYKSSTGNLRNYFADEYGMGFKIQNKDQVKIKVGELEHIVATKIYGNSSFGSTGGRSISFGKNIGTVDYAVIVTPTANPNGYIGEVWVGNMSSTGCTVYNSGSATTSFKYVVVY